MRLGAVRGKEKILSPENRFASAVFKFYLPRCLITDTEDAFDRPRVFIYFFIFYSYKRFFLVS